MRKLVLFAAVWFAVLHAPPAYAWWEFAKWGMTREELKNAGGGKVQGDDKYLFVDDIRVGGATDGEAAFGFDASGRLQRTTLMFLRDKSDRELFQVLVGVYGAPLHETLTTALWRDTTKGTVIRLTELPALAVVVYEPIAKGF